MQLLSNKGEKGCAKRKHDCAVDARKHILSLSVKHGIPFGSWYHCDICGGYHVTTKPANGRFRRL